MVHDAFPRIHVGLPPRYGDLVSRIGILGPHFISSFSCFDTTSCLSFVFHYKHPFPHCCTPSPPFSLFRSMLLPAQIRIIYYGTLAHFNVHNKMQSRRENSVSLVAIACVLTLFVYFGSWKARKLAGMLSIVAPDHTNLPPPEHRESHPLSRHKANSRCDLRVTVTVLYLLCNCNLHVLYKHNPIQPRGRSEIGQHITVINPPITFLFWHSMSTS